MSNIQTRVVKAPIVDMEETSKEDEFCDYVQNNIMKMREYTRLGNLNETPGFFQLNNALQNYNSVFCSLVSLDVTAKEEYRKARNDYEDWMAEKYTTAKNILNPPSLSASKWSSSKEIEYYIRYTWKDEFKKLLDAMDIAENKVAFCRRLLEGWNDYKFNLNTLCKNAQVEAVQLGAGVISVD